VGVRFSAPFKTGYRVSFSGVNRPGCAADRPFPSRTDVQYGSSYTSAPSPQFLLGILRDCSDGDENIGTRP